MHQVPWLCGLIPVDIESLESRAGILAQDTIAKVVLCPECGSGRQFPANGGLRAPLPGCFLPAERC